MSEVQRRLEQLTPERRRLVEQLAARCASPPDPSHADDAQPLADGAQPAEHLLTHELIDRLATAERASDPRAAKKAAVRRFYDAVNGQLDASVAHDHALFLNYGYVGDGVGERAVVELPRHALNRNCVQLVLEVVGDCPLSGRTVLDVGCGRGGTISVLDRFFTPQALVGVDLSATAIAFCRRRHASPRMRFVVGDAEALPFDARQFDRVTNIESSHSYPDVGAFYAEVARVLVSGGTFLYADTIPARAIPDRIAQLESVGLSLELSRDITANVVRSCDQAAGINAQAFSDGNAPEVLSDFLGAPESRTYELMRSGATRYGIWRLRKG
jgi:phthiocerol/phenolphthiocerol synthesis type-I polyketide synthase E